MLRSAIRFGSKLFGSHGFIRPFDGVAFTVLETWSIIPSRVSPKSGVFLKETSSANLKESSSREFKLYEISFGRPLLSDKAVLTRAVGPSCPAPMGGFVGSRPLLDS